MSTPTIPTVSPPNKAGPGQSIARAFFLPQHNNKQLGVNKCDHTKSKAIDWITRSCVECAVQLPPAVALSLLFIADKVTTVCWKRV